MKNEQHDSLYNRGIIHPALDHGAGMKSRKHIYSHEECARPRDDAESLLEDIIHRRNYTSATRDEVEAFLRRIVHRELSLLKTYKVKQ